MYIMQKHSLGLVEASYLGLEHTGEVKESTIDISHSFCLVNDFGSET